MSSLFGSSSPPGSPGQEVSNVLTPSRKVQALLAQFEDSDSDTSMHSQGTKTITKADRHGATSEHRAHGPSSQDEEDSEEEDVLQRAPRSRLLTRLEGLSPVHTAAEGSGHDFRVQEPSPTTAQDLSDEDAIARPTMRRKLLTKRKSSPVLPELDAILSGPASLSKSPSIAATPGRGSLGGSGLSDSEADKDTHSSAGKSKFLALVEKHRKERLEKEAEEAAKRAARLESIKSQEQQIRKPRGSSPADDTDEESDMSGNDGAKNLSTQARPLRKASKKALEEMNRETQRISRSMQLAHQARTKKKITKDSLLARFNFQAAPSAREPIPEEAPENASGSSSRANSDAEANNTHDTPPTSPLRDDDPLFKVGPNPTATASNHTEPVNVMHQASSPSRIAYADKGKGRALSEEAPVRMSSTGPIQRPAGHPQPKEFAASTLKSAGKSQRSRWSLAALSKVGDDDSDSDLEVITSKGDVRKYAAFEQLPKRKAKEAPSHLALRSLAHLMGGSDPKRSINAAEMEASLRKAARVQARKERQEKLEELKAKGVLVQTAEDREREQQEVEDLLERARQEAVEIQKREKALAKKEGNYSKDELDDDDSDDDEDFEDDDEGQVSEDSDNDEDDGEEDEVEGDESGLLDNEADENDSDESSSPGSPLGDMMLGAAHGLEPGRQASSNMTRKARVNRVLSDDEEEEEERPKDQPQSPQLPVPAKTPQSLSRSARKQIPGLQMSDDLPIGLTQAFAATMADSQSQDLTQGLQEQDSLTMTMDLPSPNIAMVPRLQRLDSIDVITNSQPDSQTQPLDINLSFSQSQRIPQSPRQFTPSQPQFEPTQDAGYILSPFAGNRFATDTPQHAAPHSTIDTLVLPRETQDSPVMQRKSRLRRGHERTIDSDEEELTEAAGASAFDVMRRAAKRKPQELFDKSKSHARDIVDEAAEESEDEYAGLGGASDEDVNDEENEDDRRMIDEDTEVGAGDASKLAKLFADRERQRDEADVSKLYKDLTTGALRRKRGNDDLDLSDEEDAAVRRREAKRREHAKMRRELFKDEAVGKIAEDRKKEAFLKSIEDRQVSDEEEEDDFDQPETPLEDDSQDKAQSSTELSGLERPEAKSQDVASTSKQPLETVAPSRTNQVRRSIGGRGGKGAASLNRRPATLAEIRESVSFLIEEPDSQAANVDLGLSDSEEEPEAYVDLDRHLQEAEADENAEDGDDLGDFIVDDDTPEEDQTFKKPTIPYSEVKRAPFSERRTKERGDVVDRLQMMRQSSSSSTGGGKMAFHANSVSSSSSFGKVPSLLRRATTNSSLGSNSSVTSATGVVTMRPERGRAGDEKEFVRKSTGSRRNAVNYRPTVAEEKMSQRAGIVKKTTTKKSGGGGFLGAFLGRDNWA